MKLTANVPSADLYTRARKEWQLWRELSAALVHTHAVTEEDAKSPALARETPGQRLFAMVREWGEARAELHAAMQKEADAKRIADLRATLREITRMGGNFAGMKGLADAALARHAE